MTFPVSRAALTSLALALATPSAFAQTTNDAGAVVVTATRTPQLASDVISDTLTINSTDIANSGAGSVIDLLQRQRGIEVASNGGPGTTASVFIRGANSNQNIVLVDGVRIGSSTTGAANWSAIPLSSIDHIEIVYGPLSTLYGADAVGGVIQIFTKQGKGSPQVSASIGAGSDSTQKYDASVFGATGGEHSVSYSLSVGKEKSDGFSATMPGNYSYNADDDGYDRESAAGQFSLRLAPGHELGLTFLHSKLDAQYDNGSDPYDARNLQKLDNIAVYSKNQFLPNWTSLVQVAQAKDDEASNGGVESYDRYSINTKQTDISWQNDIRLFGSDTLQVLFDHRKEEVLSTSTPELTRDRTTKSVALSYSLKRGQNLASIGVRNDDSSQYGSNKTYSVGYGYRFSSTLRASASYGTSFRAPTFNELYYPGYGLATNQPEKAHNTELGLHYDDGVTQLGASLYRNRLTNMIVNTVPCPNTDPIYSYGCAYNVNRATLEGVTLSGHRQFGDFGIGGSADWQDPKDDTAGAILARRAKKHADLTLDYGVGAYKAGLEWQLSGQRFDDAANRNALGGYGLLNLYGTYQVAPDWSILVRLNNIADKKYQLARYYSTAGSTVFVGLRYGIK